ncbi:MAG: 50S ribosomal protein L6 [Candidatus Levybacteria bacterium]|nr:50S ribosomal protein L6 [Candidatus Levybacteria bacterium]
MSKIGKTPIDIKEGVTVSLENRDIKVSGPKGTTLHLIPNGIEVNIADNKILLIQKNQAGKKAGKVSQNAIFGLTRAIIANMVKGVSEGFEKKLELSGVGYRVAMAGNDLTLSVGFSHPVKVAAAEGIKFLVAENVITVMGIDKTLVGDIAAKIRAIRVPDPYKAKGISYSGEKIRRKAGKAAKTVGTK